MKTPLKFVSTPPANKKINEVADVNGIWSLSPCVCVCWGVVDLSQSNFGEPARQKVGARPRLSRHSLILEDASVIPLLEKHSIPIPVSLLHPVRWTPQEN